MPLRCVVWNCSNTASSKKGITVHIILYYNDDRPLAKARRKQWIDFVKTKRKHWKPKKYSCVCSQHFAADYTRRFSFLSHQGKRQLVKDETGVVPIPRYSVHSVLFITFDSSGLRLSPESLCKWQLVKEHLKNIRD